MRITPLDARKQEYGVWIEKTNYGRKYWGINRETFIIDPKGAIAHHWSKTKGNEKHAEEVLNVLDSKELSGV